MKRIFLSLVSMVFAFHVATAAELRNDAFNTLPDINKASGRGDGITFSGHEDAQRDGRHFVPFIYAGGLHGTSASLTSSAFATEAFVPERVNQQSTAITYAAIANDVCWTIISSLNTGITGWTRVGTTAYYFNCEGDTTPNRPDLPSNSLWLMQVTIASSAITVVADIRNISPIQLQVLQRIINVTQPPYNVPRDGKGDASTGINEALVSASSTGYGVYLPCGTYRTIAQILLQTNTELFGQNSLCTVIAPDTSLSIPRPVLAKNVDGTYVHDLQVDCGDATVKGRQGIAGEESTNYMRVERTKVRRCGQYGVTLGDTASVAPWSSGGAGIVWKDNIVDMTGIPASACTGNIAMEYFPKGPVGYLADPGPLIEGNIVFAATADVGIKVNNSRGARIMGNIISGATCSTATGAIVVVHDQGSTIIGNTISDTRLGIAFNSLPTPNASGGNELRTEGLKIIGNTIRKPSGAAIFSSDGTTDVLITNNTILEDGGGAGPGIDLQPRTEAIGGTSYLRLSITDNTIRGFKTAIALTEDTDGTLGFPGVRIEDNTLSSLMVTAPAININNARGAVILGNYIIGYRSGIDVAGQLQSDNVDVSHNTIRDINSGNVAAMPCMTIFGDYPRIIGNLCENTSGSFHAKYGLILNKSKTPTISGNIFRSMDTGEINLVNLSSMTIAQPMPQAYCVDLRVQEPGAVTTEQTIGTCTLPAGYFTPWGGVHIIAFGDLTGVGGTKALKVYFGGTQLGSTLTATADINGYRFEGEVVMPSNQVTSPVSWLKGYNGTTLSVNAYLGLTGLDTTVGPVEIKVTCTKANAGDACRGRALVVQPWR